MSDIPWALAAVGDADEAAFEFRRSLARSMRGLRKEIGRLRLALNGGVSHPNSKGWRRHVRRKKAASRR